MFRVLGFWVYGLGQCCVNFWHADSPRYAATCRSVAEAELSNGRLAPKFKGYLEGYSSGFRS